MAELNEEAVNGAEANEAVAPIDGDVDYLVEGVDDTEAVEEEAEEASAEEVADPVIPTPEPVDPRVAAALARLEAKERELDSLVVKATQPTTPTVSEP